MTDPLPFVFWVDDDRIRVRFVGRIALGRLSEGHGVGGDYADRVIRLPRWEGATTNRAALLHELGHYLVERTELNPRRVHGDLRRVSEEEVVDLLAWIPGILTDSRNVLLRAFLGL